ncbi:MAG: NADH-quinone oxidoreductase subunit C [Desulfurococcales archaeon]|nr:NADH-quinone oxidoreductase subunit C [Desulfurococcales archaeon]
MSGAELVEGPRDYEATLKAARARAESALREAGISFSVEEGKGFVDLVVDVDSIVKAAEALKNAGFTHVVSVTAVDYPKKKSIKVAYHVTSYLDPEIVGGIVGLAVYLPREAPEMPSLSGVWVSAEFMEREVYEFFGVTFKGHPDLRPLLLIPELAEKRPLRKDFVVREESIYEGVPERVRRG